MMKTPIYDFVKNYGEKKALRLHMPGHKGNSFLGLEEKDITEIDGADVLYSARGIIEESRKNAAALFGSGETYYSCEGASLSVKAMLYLALLTNKEKGKKPLILACRNAHKVFISGAALLDFDIEWLYPRENGSVLSCDVTADILEEKLSSAEEKPLAFYVTSPDYLGNVADIKALSEVCRKYGVLLLCDNAHGAYLRFLPENRHPIFLGAHICCDSAHKTLPVLTGGAYLHISENAPEICKNNAEKALSLFASTSPSYLVLQSLDKANEYLASTYKKELQSTVNAITLLKQKLTDNGFALTGNEELKVTLVPKSYGYTGTEIADILKEKNIVCEFADKDYIVFMFTPEIKSKDMEYLAEVLLSIEKRPKIEEVPPPVSSGEKVMSVREAIFAPSETLPAEKCNGRILAQMNVSCPPAIPVAVSGERISEKEIALFEYYGIEKIDVVL